MGWWWLTVAVVTDLDLAGGSKAHRIRDTALRLFAERGAARVPLRMIAEHSGVSLGAVQHSFQTKEGLVAAVDRHVLSVLVDMLPTPDTAEDGARPVEDFGRQVGLLMTEQVDVVNYIARSLVDQTPLAAAVFDRLAVMGQRRWAQYAEDDLTRPGLDVSWAGLNPLLLCLGAIMLRSHVDRHLPAPLDTPGQLARWEDSVNMMIRFGNLRD